jgi:predicted nucleotidyltransferase
VPESQPINARDWIARLPRAVSLQADALARLLEAVEADMRVRAFQIRGSIPRGTADEYSDLDTKLWISDEQYDAFLRDLPSLARALGTPLDVLFETAGSPYLFVQFINGVQLELATGRASEVEGLIQGAVALLDRDGLLQDRWDIPAAWDEHLWLGWAWMHLLDADKYLRRGSLWKALTTLEETRALLLRHHASLDEITDPEYGIRSILDFGGTLPDRLDETVAALDAADLRRAALACAQLLNRYGRRPFADYVISRLTTQT